jgi:hypothetical protein
VQMWERRAHSLPMGADVPGRIHRRCATVRSGRAEAVSGGFHTELYIACASHRSMVVASEMKALFEYCSTFELFPPGQEPARQLCATVDHSLHALASQHHPTPHTVPIPHL